MVGNSSSNNNNTTSSTSSSNRPANPRHRLRRLQDRSYTREDLELFNLVDQPIWIFDCTGKAMYWANESALVLWNAETLEELLSRNYSDDMSEATERRLGEYMVKFRNYETVTDQWTYYPKGKGATTVHVTLSGIQIQNGADDGEGDRLMMFNEGVVPVQTQIDQENLRGVEMLRHLPVAVCQFDLEGNLMYQNPESLDLFGCPSSSAAAATSETERRRDTGEEKVPEEDEDECGSSRISLCSFKSRFVDQVLGERAFEKVQQDKDYCIEAQQKTQRDGLRWFSISLRLARDPVTSQQVILYSARDTTEMIKAKEEADRANNEKSEFLAVMAHELRTPLHQVIGFIEVLSQTQGLTEDQMEYVRLMDSASGCLMAVINDLLDYSKLEFNKLKLEKIPMDVKGVLEGCHQVILPKAKDKGLTLSCHWQPAVSKLIGNKLLGDPNRLRQILLNLLQNSVKFTHSGIISLSATRVIAPEADGSNTTTRIRFEVSDTGIGISKEDQKAIFQKYSQANVAIARRYGGTGLGLAICKSLVEIMGGQIELESELGKGCKIAFEIPFDAVADQPSSSSPMDESTREVHNKPNDSLRVLVAEDNKLNQKVIKAMLQRMGHTVVLANDGLLAVQAVEETTSSNDPDSLPFDVVLMDQQMPQMDGMEATKVLRNKGYCQCILPIVGLTANYQPAELQFYKDCGMNDCIGKPAKLNTLKKILHNIQKSKEGTDDEQPCAHCGGIGLQSNLYCRKKQDAAAAGGNSHKRLTTTTTTTRVHSPVHHHHEPTPGRQLASTA